jgi:hypothetical protein
MEPATHTPPNTRLLEGRLDPHHGLDLHYARPEVGAQCTDPPAATADARPPGQGADIPRPDDTPAGAAAAADAETMSDDWLAKDEHGPTEKRSRDNGEPTWPRPEPAPAPEPTPELAAPSEPAQAPASDEG